MKLFLFFIFFNYVLLAPSYGQKYNGYVITTKGDKIDGYIRLEVGFKDKGKKILLKQDKNKPSKIFYSYEVQEYAYGKDTVKIFKSIRPFDDERFFHYKEAIVITRGKLNLYRFEYTEKAKIPSYNNLTKTISRDYVTYVAYLVEDDKGFVTGIEKSNYEESIRYLLTNSASIGKYKDIEKVFRNYNQIEE
jgi:hypothetical protein